VASGSNEPPLGSDECNMPHWAEVESRGWVGLVVIPTTSTDTRIHGGGGE
jgi:hypothetical protein